MINIEGSWFDGHSSNKKRAWCRINDKNISIVAADTGREIARAATGEFKISPRLANTPRYIGFAGGAQFETMDNDQVDQLQREVGKTSWLGAVHLLESKYRYVFAAVAAMVLVVWLFMGYGMPWMSEKIAMRLPDGVLSVADEQTLASLDRMLLEETKLGKDRRDELLRHFRPLLRDEYPNLDLRVLFRSGGGLGPNALALPGGTIIFTDEMVKLAKDNDELTAVLAHEIGHVAERHAMRSIVQSSILGFMLLAISGDMGGVSELIVGLPVFLTEMHYSREFEREADGFSLAYLRGAGKDPMHFVNIMRRVEDSIGSRRDGDSEFMAYLSSHPETEERLQAFLKAAGKE